MGCGGSGLMVIVHAFNSSNLTSNPAKGNQRNRASKICWKVLSKEALPFVCCPFEKVFIESIRGSVVVNI